MADANPKDPAGPKKPVKDASTAVEKNQDRGNSNKSHTSEKGTSKEVVAKPSASEKESGKGSNAKSTKVKESVKDGSTKSTVVSKEVTKGSAATTGDKAETKSTAAKQAEAPGGDTSGAESKHESAAGETAKTDGAAPPAGGAADSQVTPAAAPDEQQHKSAEAETGAAEPAAGSADQSENGAPPSADKMAGKQRATRSRNPEFAAKRKNFIKDFKRSLGEKRSSGEEGAAAKRRRKSEDAPASGANGFLQLELSSDLARHDCPIFLDLSSILQHLDQSISIPVLRPCDPPSGQIQYLEGPAALNDNFCWVCHRDGRVICCETCPRVFHLKCAGLTTDPPGDWVCIECRRVVQAETVDNLSPAMKMLTHQRFTLLLKHAIGRLKGLPGAEPFIQPVDEAKFPNYHEVVACPMDLSAMEENLNKGMYGSTEAFVADCKWILHNCILFNGTTSKLTALAKSLLRMCKWEMEEIETCPDCYSNAYSSDNWFTLACPHPHLLIWARLKGFPYWPAKAVKSRDGNVDCRFFGRHDRAWVPIKECYLFSKEPPAPPKSRSKSLDACLEELEEHINNLEKSFGQFIHPGLRTVYEPRKISQHLKLMLPGYACNITRPDQEVPRRKRSSSEIQSEMLEKLRQGKKARRSVSATLQAERRGASANPEEAEEGEDEEEEDDEEDADDAANEEVDDPGSDAPRATKVARKSASKPTKSAESDGAEPQAGAAAAATASEQQSDVKKAHSTDKATGDAAADATKTPATAKSAPAAAKSAPASAAKSVAGAAKAVSAAGSKAAAGGATKSTPSTKSAAAKSTGTKSAAAKSAAAAAKSSPAAAKSAAAAAKSSPAAAKSAAAAAKSSPAAVKSATAAAKSSPAAAKSAAAAANSASTSAKSADSKPSPANGKSSAGGEPLPVAAAMGGQLTPHGQLRKVQLTAAHGQLRKVVKVAGTPLAMQEMVVMKAAAGRQRLTPGRANGIGGQAAAGGRGRPVASPRSPAVSGGQQRPLASPRLGASPALSAAAAAETHAPLPTPTRLGPMIVVPGLKKGVAGEPSEPTAGADAPSTPPHDGPISAELRQQSNSLSELIRGGLEKAMSELPQSGCPQSVVANLRLQIDRLQWRQQIELAEQRKISDTMLAELRNSMDIEQKKALNKLHTAFAAERAEWGRQTELKVADTKRKQWCATCGKEAIFYCCWNTSYCDFPCQEAQWPKHMLTCANQQGSQQSVGPAEATAGRAADEQAA